MKKTYHGQPFTLPGYCIRIAIVAMVIPGTAILLCARTHTVSLPQFPLDNTSLQPVSAAVINNYTAGKSALDLRSFSFAATPFLKGTINKRPGLSKPGLY